MLTINEKNMENCSYMFFIIIKKNTKIFMPSYKLQSFDTAFSSHHEFPTEKIFQNECVGP